MLRSIRITIWTIVVLVTLMVLLSVVAALSLNSGQAKSIISTYIENRTGRVFSIDGRLGMAMGLSTTVFAEEVRLSNSEWAQTPDMLSIGRLSISLSITGFLRGEGLIREIHAQNPVLWLERDPETGRFNLDFRKNTISASRSDPNSVFWNYLHFRQASIGKGQVIYFNPRRKLEIEITDAVARTHAIDQPIDLNMSGAVENTPIVLAGQMSSIQSIIERDESEVSLQGHIVKPENTLFIAGTISEVRRWKGLDLGFETFITDLSELSGLAGAQLVPYRDLTASWQWLQPGSPKTLRMESIKVSSSAHGLQSNLEGRIGQLPRFKQFDLTFSARGDLEHAVIPQEWNQDVVLNTDIKGTITGDREDLRLSVIHGAIQSEGMKLNLTGTVERLPGDWTSPLEVSLELDDLTTLGNLINRDLPSVPKLSVSADIYRLDKKFNLFNFLLDNDSPKIKVLAAGSIENPGAQQQGVIDFTAQAGTDFIGQFTDSRVAGLLQDLNITGTINLTADEVSIPDLRIDAAGQGIRIDGAGEFGSISHPETLKVDFKASVQGLDKLSDWVGQPLPPTETIAGSASLYGNAQQKLTLGNIQLNLTDPAVSAALSGEIRNLGKSQTLVMDFDVELRQADFILGHFPDLPMKQLVTELMPAKGRGQLRSVDMQNGRISHSMENLDISSDADLKGRVTGHIDHLFTRQWGGPVSISVYGELGERSLPSVHSDLVDLEGYLHSTAEVSVSGQGLKVDQIDARVISGYSETRVSGKIENLSPFETTGLELIIDRPSLDALLVEGAWPALARENPVSGRLGFQNAGQPGQLSLDLKVADSDLTGHLYWPPDNDKQSESGNTQTGMTGRFTSLNMDLVQLLKKSGDSPHFFSHKPILLPWLEDLNIEIEADFKRFRNSILLLGNVVSDTVVREGRLNTEITSESARAGTGKTGPGSLAIGLSLSNQSQGRLKSRIVLEGEDVDLSALISAGELDFKHKGSFSIQTDIKGSGGSVAEIMGSANGPVLFRLNDATLKHQRLRLFGSDLFLGLLTIVNPFANQDEIINLECGVIHFDINNGLATSGQGIALQTTGFTMLGGGEVDLSEENLDLAVSTKARKGLGVNVSTFANLIIVEGKISDPEVRAGGLLQGGVSLGVGFLTGGLSLIAKGLLDQLKANSDVCAMAADG